MPTKTSLLASAAGLAALVLQAFAPAFAQNAAALSGAVSSAKEGPMEGVLVSARKDGSTITVSVVTDDKGHFSFPASRLDPGHYAISIRATGYDLDAPKDATIAAGQEDKIDVKLKPARNLSAQLTNAEWLMSMPGSDEQKRFVLACNGCHTLERIVRSTHDADEFMQVFKRMAHYYPGSTPLKPQPLAGNVGRNVGNGPQAQQAAEWLASINLSQQNTWSWPLKTLPRLTGKSTQVIITEYDLPNTDAGQLGHLAVEGTPADDKVWIKNSDGGHIYRLDLASNKFEDLGAPKDPRTGKRIGTYGIHADAENNLYLLDFSAGNIVRIDAKTKEPTVYLTPTPNSHPRRGRVDDQGRLWFAEYFGNAIGMLDPETGKIQEWKVPMPWSSPYDAVADKNGNAWTASMNTDRVARLDIQSGQYTEYPLPRPTNIRRVFVDDAKNPGTLWIGSNHGASIVKVEPLD